MGCQRSRVRNVDINSLPIGHNPISSQEKNEVP